FAWKVYGLESVTSTAYVKSCGSWTEYTLRTEIGSRAWSGCGSAAREPENTAEGDGTMAVVPSGSRVGEPSRICTFACASRSAMKRELAGAASAVAAAGSTTLSGVMTGR